MKELITIAVGDSECQITKPSRYPVSFKEFLRIIVGAIPSARTETERTRYYREFLGWWAMSLDEAGVCKSPEPDKLIEGFRQNGLTEKQFNTHAIIFGRWRADLISRRNKANVEARWKKVKPPLDSHRKRKK